MVWMVFRMVAPKNNAATQWLLLRRGCCCFRSGVLLRSLVMVLIITFHRSHGNQANCSWQRLSKMIRARTWYYYTDHNIYPDHIAKCKIAPVLFTVTRIRHCPRKIGWRRCSVKLYPWRIGSSPSSFTVNHINQNLYKSPTSRYHGSSSRQIQPETTKRPRQQQEARALWKVVHSDVQVHFGR